MIAQATGTEAKYEFLFIIDGELLQTNIQT